MKLDAEDKHTGTISQPKLGSGPRLLGSLTGILLLALDRRLGMTGGLYRFLQLPELSMVAGSNVSNVVLFVFVESPDFSRIQTNFP